MVLTQERNVSARKMGPTITKELGEESVFSAHRGERAQLCSSGSPAAAAETTGTPQEVQRNWGSQQELPLKSKLHQSHFSVSISTPLSSSLHWAQPPPAPRAPAKASLQGQLLCPSNWRGNPGLPPPAKPKPCCLLLLQPLLILKNFGTFGFKIKPRKIWEQSIPNSLQKEWEREAASHHRYVLSTAQFSLLIKLSEAPSSLSGFGNSVRNSRSSFSNLTPSLHEIKYERTPSAEIADNGYPHL